MTEPTAPLSVRIADLLEQLAMKIREMTVDRAAVAVTWMAVGLMLVVGMIMAIFWLFVGIFRALGTLMGTETAYAVVGMILILVGALVWYLRYPQDQTSQE